MNERIKELAKKSGLITHEVPNGLAHLHTMVDVEKFAELIIKECIDKIQSNRKIYNPSEWDQGADWGLNDSTNTIKGHFGVE